MRAQARSMTRSLRTAALFALLAPLPLGVAGAASPEAKPAQARSDDATTAGAEVDCALPARIDRLSEQVTMLGARQIVQLAPEECRERGGEVVREGSSAERATKSAD